MRSFTDHLAPRRLAVLLVALLAALATLTACSSDGSPSSGAETSAQGSSKGTAAPEHTQVPVSEVHAKAPQLIQLGKDAKDAAAAGKWDEAAGMPHEIEEVWEQVEGTIKALDPEVYEQIETAQGLIGDGIEAKKADRVAQGSQDQATAVQKFLTEHPA